MTPTLSPLPTCRPLALLLLLLLLLACPPRPALAQGGGTIEGRVEIAGEGELPGGLEVELLFLPNGQGPPVITAQPLAADGSFRFEGVESGPQHRYLVRVQVEGEDNLSDLLAFAPDERVKQVTVRLFARTTDASALSLREVSYVLDLQAEGWLVVTLYRYHNEGDRIIENLTDPPARVTLPLDATNVQFSEGVNFNGIVELRDGFAYTGPFEPGDTPLIFSYALPYAAGEQGLTLTPDTPTERVRVLVPQLGQRTTADGLTLTGPQDIQGRAYELFEAQSPAPNQPFSLRFAGLPPAPTPLPAATSDTFSGTPSGPRLLLVSPLERLPRWAPLLPMALAALGVFAYLAARPTPSAAEERARLRERRDALIAEIAALDIRFEAGAMGEQTHRRQRTLLKEELKEVLRQQGATGGRKGDEGEAESL